MTFVAFMQLGILQEPSQQYIHCKKNLITLHTSQSQTYADTIHIGSSIYLQQAVSNIIIITKLC